MALNPAQPDFTSLPADIAAGVSALFRDQVYCVPVRHHSPACAFALQHMIAELKPAVILIEAPDTFNELLPLLTDSLTKPPVAILAQQAGTESGSRAGSEVEHAQSAFYPFSEYSPEWVALRAGSECGAKVAFIDQPWLHRAENASADKPDSASENLQAERYLAHSQWLKALAEASSCRDHHELWDHLFELRSKATLTDWRTLFTEVFCWCSMARVDYEPEVLEAEQSLPRERHMAAWIQHWRAKTDGPIIVVTGGFHTAELIRLVHQDSQRKPEQPKASRNAAGQWLIRYGFAQLDALNNYAAGMPAPAFYQLLWQALNSSDKNPWLSSTADMLQQVVSLSRDKDSIDALSTADLQAATLQAIRLAELRGHAGPGRTDLLDAMTSCFLKRDYQDGHGGLFTDIHTLMAGTAIGNVPASAGSPPLVEDARRQAAQHRLRLDDSAARTAKLDLYRKAPHVHRSRFFYLMDYLGTGLARRLGGPDFISGTRLDMLFEEWLYAWTPHVEARLIELSSLGTTLQAVGLRKILQEEQALNEAGQSRSASGAVRLLMRAVLVGLHRYLPELFTLLDNHLREDPSFQSVVECGHQLLTLWQAREPLGVQGNPEIQRLLKRTWTAALFLLPGLAGTQVGDEATVIRQLVAFRELGRRLQQNESAVDMTVLQQGLQQLAGVRDCAPGIEAAASAILYLEGVLSGTELAHRLKTHFGEGAMTESAARYLNGLMTTAPELLLHEPALLTEFNTLLRAWPEEDFIAWLPDLRHAFTFLNPQETDRLAKLVVSELNEENSALFQTHYSASENDMLQGVQLQQRLRRALAEDGLEGWAIAWDSPSDTAKGGRKPPHD